MKLLKKEGGILKYFALNGQRIIKEEIRKECVVSFVFRNALREIKGNYKRREEGVCGRLFSWLASKFID